MVAFFVSGCKRVITLAVYVEISVKYSKSLCAIDEIGVLNFYQLFEREVDHHIQVDSTNFNH